MPRDAHPEPARGAAHRHGATAGQTPPGRCVGTRPPTVPRRLPPCFPAGPTRPGLCGGHTIRFAYRYGEDHADRLPTLLTELVQLAPDVIWLHSTPAVVAAKQATTSIPIVIAAASDLVER